MNPVVKLGERETGADHPIYIVAEIGINHNGDMSVCRKLIDAAALAGCDAVKFQKRKPELCVPPAQRMVMRETPWGLMSYMDYRKKIEFWEDQYQEIDAYAKQRGIAWFASVWDIPSVDFMSSFKPVCYKIPSAALTDDALLSYVAKLDVPVMLSTGMSTMAQIRHAVSLLDRSKLLIAHATSAYPCKNEELNLRMIRTLQHEFPECPVGYSGHEVGLQTSLAAKVLGACFLERHITLDRAMWGSDQAASVEPQGLLKLTRDLRVIEKAMGDGVKQIYESEKRSMKKLRRQYWSEGRKGDTVVMEET